jgi:hypothetical protein
MSLARSDSDAAILAYPLVLSDCHASLAMTWSWVLSTKLAEIPSNYKNHVIDICHCGEAISAYPLVLADCHASLAMTWFQVFSIELAEIHSDYKIDLQDYVIARSDIDAAISAYPLVLSDCHAPLAMTWSWVLLIELAEMHSDYKIYVIARSDTDAAISAYPLVLSDCHPSLAMTWFCRYRKCSIF